MKILGKKNLFFFQKMTQFEQMDHVAAYYRYIVCMRHPLKMTSSQAGFEHM
jgi:hypothetical protein